MKAKGSMEAEERREVLLKRRKIAFVLLVIAVVIFVWSQKDPWQISKYDRWSRMKLSEIGGLIEEGRQMVALSPDKYDYNRLRSIRGRIMALQKSTRSVPWYLSSDREISALNKTFSHAVLEMPIHFTSEDIKQPVKDFPPEPHQRYLRFAQEIGQWKTALDALEKEHKVKSGIWEPTELVPY